MSKKQIIINENELKNEEETKTPTTSEDEREFIRATKATMGKKELETVEKLSKRPRGRPRKDPNIEVMP